MNSMTGFGRAERNCSCGKVIIEISSVNNRFLEFSFRLQRPFHLLESQLRDSLSKMLSRGKVTVTLAVEETDQAPKRFFISKAAVRSYTRQLRLLAKELNLEGDVRISDLVALPDVVHPEQESINPAKTWREIEPVAIRAMGALIKMRGREGRALKTDMAKRLSTMIKQVAVVEKRTAGSVQIYAQRLQQRINDLLVNGQPDPGRLEQEIAFFADRSDISEEITRLRSHLKQYRQSLKQRAAMGRRLTFLLQEMNREVNTIGSKSADFSVSTEVISLKEEMEKLREQVQNVE